MKSRSQPFLLDGENLIAFSKKKKKKKVKFTLFLQFSNLILLIICVFNVNFSLRHSKGRMFA